MRKIKNPPSNVIISRTDSIGDVVLTLPVAAALKKKFPEMKIGFMGNAYTKSVIEACEYVDMFIDVEDFLNDIILVCNEIPKAIIHVLPVKVIAKRAKELKIPIRIGTRNRIYHWATCNYLVELSRKKSILHESQLNLKLLKPFGLTQNLSTEELWQFFGLTKIKPLDQRLASLIDDKKYNLIIHPKSRGNGREWGLVNFIKLVRLLDKNKFKIFISGLEKEKIALNPLFNEVGESVTNITGIMNLSEFMSFIANCNGLVASGTGPVHLAAALGIDAFGIYPPIHPIHPGRWAPVGSGAKVFVLNRECNICKGNRSSCQCILNIDPFLIKDALDKAFQVQKKSGDEA